MYEDEVAAVVAVRKEEIEADLALARTGLRRAQGDVRDYERQVQVCEALLGLVPRPADGNAADDSMTLHRAMEMVLREAPGRMLRAGDLAAHINERRLYRMRDGRPVEAQQIHARTNNYPHLFTKRGTFITLVEEDHEL